MMLKAGIKLGPRDWELKLIKSQAEYAEIWYQIDRPEWYQDMFKTLHDRGVAFGLHFWGVTTSGHEANLAYPGENLTASIDLIKTCIDHAIDQQASYVNIHSGNRRLMNLYPNELSQIVPDTHSPEISDTKAAATRNHILSELGHYANSHQVQLLVEAIPQKVATDSRLNPTYQYPVNLTGILDLCHQGLIGFTNDFCHTFAFDASHFDNITAAFAPYTKVVHINTLTPPYNGTDEHRGILPDDFDVPGVFPNKDKLIDLLRLLHQQSKSDVWLIGEPKDQHVENYFELSRLLSTLSKGE